MYIKSIDKTWFIIYIKICLTEYFKPGEKASDFFHCERGDDAVVGDFVDLVGRAGFERQKVS